MADKKFASQGDLAEKKATFSELADGVYAYTTEGDPNTGVVVGDDSVLIMDARATPVLAQELIDVIRGVTDKPIKYVVLSHYHAVRVLGASAYGAEYIIASEMTRDLIAERGQQDFESEVQRFPRLFQSVETVPGLTWPNITFSDRMSLWLGSREVRLMHLGKGHTKGDIVAWLPEEKVCFSGDLVEYGATPYAGDSYPREWIRTLERVKALGAERMVPGRGEALVGADQVRYAIEQTQAFLETMVGAIEGGVRQGHDLRAVYSSTYAALKPAFGDWVIFDHCLPFDVSRAFDAENGITDPRIWTAERDIEMWKSLEE